MIKILNFLNLLIVFVKREIKSKVAGTFLGPINIFLQPFLQCLLYIFLFNIIFRVKIRVSYGEENFINYFLVGFIPWSIHAEALLQGSQAILINRYVVSKVIFPSEVLPVSVVLATYLVWLPSFIFLFLYIGFIYSFKMVFLVGVLVLIMQLLFSIGVSLCFASLVVYLRDLHQFLSTFIVVWFYATPILYSISMVPLKIRFLFKINPFYFYIKLWHNIFLFCNVKIWDLLLIANLSAISFGVGLYIFKKLKHGFSEIL